MLFLLAIGISTMAAAFANAGYIMRQSDYSRVRLLHESIHDNIMHSLLLDPEDETLLGYQIAMAIFRANDPTDTDYVHPPDDDEPAPGLGDIPLTIRIDDIPIGNFGARITVDSIILSFPNQFVSIIEAIPYEPQFPPNNPPSIQLPDDEIITQRRWREPRTATVNASMVVEVVITSGDRTITSIAVYEYTGGRLADYPISTDYEPSTTKMEFLHAVGYPYNTPCGYGTWSMIRYEIANW
jgi:hypothetical protein